MIDIFLKIASRAKNFIPIHKITFYITRYFFSRKKNIQKTISYNTFVNFHKNLRFQKNLNENEIEFIPYYIKALKILSKTKLIKNKRIDKYNTQTILKNIKKNRIAPLNYIERDIQEYNENNNEYFLKNKSKKLYEYITDNQKNLIVLYSEPQLGKTTEMENLAYKLQEKGSFQPCLFSLKSYRTNKLKDQLSEHIDLYNDNIFLILDGLDEASNIDRPRIIKEIEEIAELYNNISIIVSCRENFKATNVLDDFKKLYLTSLTRNEAYTYISNESTDSKDIIHKFEEIEFESFMFSPFYLKSIIKYYNDNKKTLPKSKTELYDYFISESFSQNKNNQKYKNEYISKKIKSKTILTKIAFCLCATEKQEITTTELKNKLNFKKDDIEMCCDFSILKKKKEKIFFSHSVFKEFLTAKFLKSKSFEELKPYICLTNTERLNPSWYNVIILLIGILEEDDKLLDPLITWLEENEKELLINSNTHFINRDKKTQIFKAFFKDYKNFDNYLSFDIESKLANFGDANEISKYLYSEISNPPKNETESKYLINFAFRIIKNINWLNLNSQNKEKLETLLFEHLELTKLDNYQNYSFLYNFDNKHFYKEEKIEKIFNIIKDCEEPHALNSVFNLITSAKLCDKYADWIFEKKKFFNRINTLSFDKYNLNKAISLFEKPQNIKRAVDYFLSIYELSNSKLDNTFKILINLLNKENNLYKEDKTTKDHIIGLLLNNNNHLYIKDTETEKLFTVFRSFFFDNNIDSEIFKEYYTDNNIKKFKEEFNSGNIIEYGNRERIISLLMTNERLDEIISDSKEINIDFRFNYVNFFACEFYHKQNNEWKEKINALYNKPIPKRGNFQEEAQKGFNILFNYERFKTEVYNVIEIIGNTDDNDAFNDNIYRYAITESIQNYFFSFHGSPKEKCICAKENISTKEKFISNFAINNATEYIANKNLNISEKQKEIIKEWIISSIETTPARYNILQYIKTIKKLDLDIEENTLIKLLEYSDRDTEKIYNENPDNLFIEYLNKKISTNLLCEKINEFLNKDLSNYGHLYICFSSFIIRHEYKQCYESLRNCLLKDMEYYNNNIISDLLKLEREQEGLNLISAIYEELPLKVKVEFLYQLSNNENLTNYYGKENIINNLKAIYKNNSYEKIYNYRLLQTLLNIGNTFGLKLFVRYIKTISNDNNSIYLNLSNYNIDNIKDIAKIIEIEKNYILKNSFDDYYDTAMFTMQKLALENERNLLLVKKELNAIYEKNHNLVELKRRIKYLTIKYYEKNNAKIDLATALELYNKLNS